MTDNNNETENINVEEKKLIWPMGLAAVGILIVLVPFLLKFWSPTFSSDPNDFVTFSNYLGGLASPIIALSILIYVYNTFKLQKTELKEARAEFKRSREEQEKQTHISKLENKLDILKQQHSWTLKRIDDGNFLFSTEGERQEELINKMASILSTSQRKDIDDEIERCSVNRKKIFESYEGNSELKSKLEEEIMSLTNELEKI